MPSPSLEPSALLVFIRDKPHDWTALVDKFSFLHSALDRQEAPANDGIPVGNYVCQECVGESRAFSTQRALDQHRRRVHGKRSGIRVYVDGSGCCPVCKTYFHTRLRVLAHLSDKRRRRCSDILENGFYEPLDPQVILELERADNEALRSAKRDGHSHAIAIGSATTHDGKRIGHVRH